MDYSAHVVWRVSDNSFSFMYGIDPTKACFSVRGSAYEAVLVLSACPCSSIGYPSTFGYAFSTRTPDRSNRWSRGLDWFK